jgi:hypothetical protein
MWDVGVQITAARAAGAIYETFGHLEAKVGERHEGYMFDLVREGKPCAQFGIYRFDGYYTQPSRKNGRRFVGKVTQMMVFE